MTLNFPGLRPACRNALAFAAICMATAVHPQTFGQEGQIRAVVTATDAYIPAPARLVAAGRIDAVSPDPRGRYVLVTRRDPPPLTGAPDLSTPNYRGDPEYGCGVSLLLYDSATGRVRTIWEQPAPDDANPVQGKAYTMGWFTGTDTALAEVSTGQSVQDKSAVNDPHHAISRLLLIQPSSASRRYSEILHGSSISSMMSRAGQPTALLTISTASADGKSWQSHYATVDSRGNIVDLPEVDASQYHTDMSSRDGRTFYFFRRARPDEVQKVDPENPEFRYIAFDLPTRKTTMLDGPPTGSKPTVPENVLRLKSGEAIAKSPAGPSTVRATSTLIKPLFLVCSDNAVNKSCLPDAIMVAPHGESGILLADNSAVLYQSQQTLYAVPLLRLPLGEYSALLRERVMTNAKSLAISLNSYSQDYDGFLPPASGVNDRISPYVRSATWFEDPATGAMAFQYQLNGQPFPGTGTAETTTEGYLDCAFGRATIYADGHVVWSESH